MKSQIVKILFVVAVFALLNQSANASIKLDTAPDAGSTSLLMAIACGGLVAARRQFKR